MHIKKHSFLPLDLCNVLLVIDTSVAFKSGRF